MSLPSEIKPYYEDEHVTLYNADCLEHPELWTIADVLVTDPPYGIRFEKLGGMNSKNHGHNGGTDYIAGDQSVDARDSAIGLWGRRPYVAFGSWKATRPNGVRSRIVWWKRGSGMEMTWCTVMTRDEEIYLSGDGWIKTRGGIPSVIATSEHRSSFTASVGHPNAKPVELMENLLSLAPADWVIADPFAGSGSTLVAARNLGRHAIGVELEERYCEIAARRLSQGVFDMGEVS